MARSRSNHRRHFGRYGHETEGYTTRRPHEFDVDGAARAFGYPHRRWLLGLSCPIRRLMYEVIASTHARLPRRRFRTIQDWHEAGRVRCSRSGRSSGYLSFTVGLIGTGRLDVPIFAGCATHAAAQWCGSEHWKASRWPLQLSL